MEKLLQELKSLRTKGKLKTLVIRCPTGELSANQMLAHELTELLSGAEDTSYPTWIDDRMLSSYSKIGGHFPSLASMMFWIICILGKRLRLENIASAIGDLIRSGIICRLPPPEYLFDELK